MGGNMSLEYWPSPQYAETATNDAAITVGATVTAPNGLGQTEAHLLSHRAPPPAHG